MDDFTTQFHVALQRATDGLSDEIAKDGLHVFKGIIDAAGFGRSEYLKDYDLLAHVDGNEITFELLINFSALEMRDKQVQEMVESAKPGAVSEAARTYGIGINGVQRLIGPRDARKEAFDRRTPTRDARRPTRDARRMAGQRIIGHEMAQHMPRSMNVNREGKLSVMFRKSLREGTSEIHYPKGKLQGLIAQFMDKLTYTIQEKFSPELEKVMARYVK